MKHLIGEAIFYGFLIMLVLGLFFELSQVSGETQRILIWWALLQQK